jgi:hypothetical protein
MPALGDTVAAREYDAATLSWLGFWADHFGDLELTETTADEVNAALVRPAASSRPGDRKPVVPASRSPRPASTATSPSLAVSASSPAGGG